MAIFLEHTFYENAGCLYCEKVINNNYLKRYLEIFDEILICARESEDNKITLTGNRIDLKKITFVGIPNYNSDGIMFHQKKCLTIFSNAVKDVDGIIIRGPSSISYLAMKIVHKHRKPYIVEMVINPTNFFPTRKNLIVNLKNLIGKNIIIRHTRNMCLTANGVAYVTKSVLQKEFPCFSLLNGESDQYFHSYYLDLELKDKDYCMEIYEHSSTHDEFCICHTGWMVGETKGHRNVINVAKELTDKGYNIKVNFIGDGPQKDIFMNYAAQLGLGSRIIFHGQINDFEMIKKILRSSHLFLFPSLIEGLPRAIVEAMANSLPCIASKSDGIPELIDEEWLCNPYDVDEMVKKVELLINDEMARTQLAKSNYIKSLEYKKEIFDNERSIFFKKFAKLLNGNY